MPALNSIASHAQKGNSGFSTSRPSRIVPIREKPQYSAKTTNPVTARMYHQPIPLLIAEFRLVKAFSAVDEKMTEKMMRPKITIDAGMKTGGFIARQAAFSAPGLSVVSPGGLVVATIASYSRRHLVTRASHHWFIPWRVVRW